VKTWSTPVCIEETSIIPCSCCGGQVFKNAFCCEGFKFVRCTACGLVQQNPQPVKDEIIARYSGKYGNDYLSYELENETSFLKLQRLALKDADFFKLEKALLLRTEEAPSVLDVGCATGALPAFLSERGWHVTGVEISPGAEYARNERKLDVRNLPLEENKFPKDSFDVVLASHLIEHLNDPHSFLAEIRRVMKKNGRLYITTPNISGFQGRLYGHLWRSAIFDHLYLFSARTLKMLLNITGFKIERIRTWGGLAAGLAPLWLKKTADFMAKRLGLGDVMIVRARRN
jgi:SAM-dependent methyltransferase